MKKAKNVCLQNGPDYFLTGKVSMHDRLEDRREWRHADAGGDLEVIIKLDRFKKNEKKKYFSKIDTIQFFKKVII
jgi:hypothetical protein